MSLTPGTGTTQDQVDLAMDTTNKQCISLQNYTNGRKSLGMSSGLLLPGITAHDKVESARECKLKNTECIHSPTESTQFCSLPAEVQISIAAYVDEESLQNLRLTCRELQKTMCPERFRVLNLSRDQLGYRILSISGAESFMQRMAGPLRQTGTFCSISTTHI